jgi:hypothetical protein
MFIKFKNAFFNMDQVATIFSPDGDYPNGALLFVKGSAVDLEPGEYEALSNYLLATGAPNLATVAQAGDIYREAAARAPIDHALQTQAATLQFDRSFQKEKETKPNPPPSQAMNPEQRPETRTAETLPPSITNRPGVFPDQFEDL